MKVFHKLRCKNGYKFLYCNTQKLECYIKTNNNNYLKIAHWVDYKFCIFFYFNAKNGCCIRCYTKDNKVEFEIEDITSDVIREAENYGLDNILDGETLHKNDLSFLSTISFCNLGLFKVETGEENYDG